MGKYLNKINLVSFNILILHFYQIHELIDGIVIDVYVPLKKVFTNIIQKVLGGNARGLGHSRNNGPLKSEAKGQLFWQCLGPRLLHNIKHKVFKNKK